MRILFAPAMLLVLSGCAALAIPPALTIASYATDGVSYLATDKSVTDHMLSDALGRNCAMWRILRGRSICKDFTPEEVAARAKARREQRHDDERAQIAQIEGPYSPSGAAAGTAIAQSPKKTVQPSPVVGASTGGSKVVRRELAAIAPAAGVSGSKPIKLALAGKSAAKAARTAPRGKPRTISDILAGTAKAKTPPGTYRRAVAKRSPKPFRRVRSALSGLRRFIVFGSFRNKRAAARLARRHQILDPFVVPARVRGATYYRVVTQPEGRANIAMAWRSLRRAGVKDAYAIRACRAGRVNARCLRQVPRQDRVTRSKFDELLTPKQSARPGAAGTVAGG